MLTFRTNILNQAFGFYIKQYSISTTISLIFYFYHYGLTLATELFIFPFFFFYGLIYFLLNDFFISTELFNNYAFFLYRSGIYFLALVAIIFYKVSVFNPNLFLFLSFIYCLCFIQCGNFLTKISDVGGDYYGKIMTNIGEDSSKNPFSILDNIGDVVGDQLGRAYQTISIFFYILSLFPQENHLLIFLIITFFSLIKALIFLTPTSNLFITEIITFSLLLKICFSKVHLISLIAFRVVLLSVLFLTSLDPILNINLLTLRKMLRKFSNISFIKGVTISTISLFIALLFFSSKYVNYSDYFISLFFFRVIMFYDAIGRLCDLTNGEKERSGLPENPIYMNLDIIGNSIKAFTKIFLGLNLYFSSNKIIIFSQAIVPIFYLTLSVSVFFLFLFLVVPYIEENNIYDTIYYFSLIMRLLCITLIPFKINFGFLVSFFILDICSNLYGAIADNYKKSFESKSKNTDHTKYKEAVLFDLEGDITKDYLSPISLGLIMYSLIKI